MGQIKIYALRSELTTLRQDISEVIHSCMVETLQLPNDKRFHRFFPMEYDDYIYPTDRSQRYTIIEISMFEGRSIETKKQLINLLYQRFETTLGICALDLEICIYESPRHNWGIRGLPGDELNLSYKVEV